MPDRLKVLIVEDDNAYVVMLREFLEPALDLRHARTLREGLSTSWSWNPAIVLLDLCLPDSAGVDTLTRFRRDGLDIPIIAMSALMDDDLVEACLRAGAEHALDKDLLMPGASDLLVWLLRTTDLYERTRRSSTTDPALPSHVNETIALSSDMIMELRRRVALQ